MDKNKLKKTDDWIKAQSKSRPGRYYMFNRSTGETRWISCDKTSEANGTSPTNKEKTLETPPPKLPDPKPLKTPAQDRLKRLQHNIKHEQAKKQQTKNIQRKSTEEQGTSKKRTDISKAEQENVQNEPSSCGSKLKTSPTIRATRQFLSGLVLPAVKETKRELKTSTSPTKCSRDLPPAKVTRHHKSTEASETIKKERQRPSTSEEKASISPKTPLKTSPRQARKRKHSPSSTTAIDKSDKKDVEVATPSKDNNNRCKESLDNTPRTSLHSTTRLLKSSEITTKPTLYKTAQTEEIKKGDSGVTPRKKLEIDLETQPCASKIRMLKLETPLYVVQETCDKNYSSFGFISKIKEFCKLPFSSYKSQDKTDNKNDSFSMSLHSHNKQHKEEGKTKVANQVFDTPHNSSVYSTPNTNLSSYHSNPSVSSTPVQRKLQLFREEQKAFSKESSSGFNLPTISSSSSSPNTPTNLNIPSYHIGSANSRLDRLRQSLLVQQNNAKNNTFTENVSSNISNTSSTLNSSHSTPHFNCSTNSVFHTANNTFNDEPEAMDWQPIIMDESIDLSSSESGLSKLLTPHTNLATKSVAETKSTTNSLAKKLPETMGEIYDAVNENLLRMSAEKKNHSSRNNNKWRKDFYYFVVDTNVLLDHLTFIEDLTKFKLCDTQGSMLYIPYSVLQELDKLKMRSGHQEGVKTLAVRAIKYLNKKLENDSQHVLAQTAVEERDHYIEVNSADDSIINCCLQAKTHVPNILLLTEDVNLRSKAICNNILVSTKSDLVSKRYDKGSSASINIS
uniref:PIN domain-containing protein n=1 Tax=Stomoxys calcitrans TaxID=35570 RepID=A0A1I8P987_STOCA